MQAQIFPLPEQPLQYRAIGLIRGKYIPSQQSFNKGILLASDGIVIDAVVLGQLLGLAQKHLDLQQEQWWVVYPRTRTKAPHLHVQIQGVRSPQSQNPSFTEKQSSSELVNEPDAFSIRGEVVRQDVQAGQIVIRIRQASRESSGQAKAFRLKLEGFLPTRGIGWFWDLRVQREGERLVVQDGQRIARILHQKPKRRRSRGQKSNNPTKRRYLPDLDSKLSSR